MGKQVWNLYGPTETTTYSTAVLVANADLPLSIGRPIDNTQIYILDTQFQAVPAGVVAVTLCAAVPPVFGMVKLLVTVVEL